MKLREEDKNYINSLLGQINQKMLNEFCKPIADLLLNVDIQKDVEDQDYFIFTDNWAQYWSHIFQLSRMYGPMILDGKGQLIRLVEDILCVRILCRELNQKYLNRKGRAIVAMTKEGESFTYIMGFTDNIDFDGGFDLPDVNEYWQIID